jgi:hypothetical protein
MADGQTSNLRIAVVGVGSRAAVYLETIACLNDLYTLVGVADRSEERRNAAAERLRIPAFADAEQMMDRTRPDIILICVPPDGHHVMTEAAARRGIHVLTEVPIATTLPMADAMVASAAHHGVKLEIAEQVLRWPTERLKQRIVQAGVIGRITQAHLWYRSGSYHGMSAIRAVIQAPPRRVLGVAAEIEGPTRPDLMNRPRQNHPWELGVVEFSDGSTCVYQQPIHLARGNLWEFVGTAGYISGAEVVVEGPEIRRYAIERVVEDRCGVSALTALRIATDPPVVWENPHQQYGLVSDDDVARADILIGMHRAVTKDEELPYGAASARGEQEVLLALRESARLGSIWVDLPLKSITGVESALHDEYRSHYGSDPLTAAGSLSETVFPRQGVYVDPSHTGGQP